MRKLFKNKRDRSVFAAMSVVFLLLLVGFMNARSFERDWYNMEYRDYQKEPERYTVTDVPIKEFRTYSGSNDKSLTITDLYFTAIVEVTYAGGQTDTYRVPAANGDKVGDKIKIAYDKRYDDDYETMLKAAKTSEGDPYKTAPRVGHVTNTKYSTGILIAEVVLCIAMSMFIFRRLRAPEDDDRF